MYDRLTLAIVAMLAAFVARGVHAHDADPTDTSLLDGSPGEDATAAALTLQLAQDSDLLTNERSTGPLYIFELRRRGGDGAAVEADVQLPTLRYVQSFANIGTADQLTTLMENDVNAALIRLDFTAAEPTAITRTIAGVERTGTARSVTVPNSEGFSIESFAWTRGDGGRVEGLIYKLPEANQPGREELLALIASAETRLISPMTPIGVAIADTTVWLPAQHRIAASEPVRMPDGAGVDLGIDTAAGRLLMRVVNAPVGKAGTQRITADYMRSWEQNTTRWSTLISRATIAMPVGDRFKRLRLRWVRTTEGDTELITVCGGHALKNHAIAFSHVHAIDGRANSLRMIGELLVPPESVIDHTLPPTTYWVDGAAWAGPPSLEIVRDEAATDALRAARVHWLLPSMGSTLDVRLTAAQELRSTFMRRVLFSTGTPTDGLTIAVERDLIERLRQAMPGRSGVDDAVREPMGADGVLTGVRVRTGFGSQFTERRLELHTSPPVRLDDGRVVVHQLITPLFTRGYNDRLFDAVRGKPEMTNGGDALRFGLIELPIDKSQDVLVRLPDPASRDVNGATVGIFRGDVRIRGAWVDLPPSSHEGLSLPEIAAQRHNAELGEFSSITIGAQPAVYRLEEPRRVESQTRTRARVVLRGSKPNELWTISLDVIGAPEAVDAASAETQVAEVLATFRPLGG